MAASSDVGLPDVSSPRGSFRADPVAVRRFVGLVLVAAVVTAFFVFVDQARLDAVRDDVAAATSGSGTVASAGVSSNCFQGFCFEDDAGFLEKWWEFSITFLRLVWPGLLLAFVVGGIVDGFLFPTSAGPAHGTWRTAGTGRRADLGGTAILPASGRPEVAAFLLVGALSAPALAMTMVLFTPVVWLTRIGLALLVAAPILFATRARSEASVRHSSGSPAHELAGAARAAAVAAWTFTLRLAPLFVLAGLVGALGTRFLTLGGVEAVAGRHLLGVLLAAVVGLLLPLPLTFGLPVAALGLLVGMDPVVAGVLLVTATMAGPGAFLAGFGLSGREQVAVAAALALTLVGSVGMLGASRVAVALAGGPSVTWDGERCGYNGPSRIESGLSTFTIRNEATSSGDRNTLAVVIGRLPANVSIDHFSTTVAADPTATPAWFEVAGTVEFVFPGTEHDAEIELEEPGVHAAVCLGEGAAEQTFVVEE